MKAFTHINANSIEEAVTLLAQYHGRAKLNAGGTDLLGVLKDRLLPDYPEAIINIKTIPGLNSCQETDRQIVIGALTTLIEIIKSPLIGQAVPLLKEAALTVASPQIRNIATIGGNLAQDTRCWYYRYPDQIGGIINCFRKSGNSCPAVAGDNRYHAIMGAKKCHAVCPSDTAVALTALGATLTIAGVQGMRTVPVEEFFKPRGNVLAPDEMIATITIPKPAAVVRQSFQKFTLRNPIDFAVVSAASFMTLEQGICTSARVVLGAVAPAPVRAWQAEEFLLGKSITPETAAAAARLAVLKAKPLAKNAYKVEIAKTLVERVVGDVPPNMQ